MVDVADGTPAHGGESVDRDIHNVTARLHDVAFEVLSSSLADGDSVNAFRLTVTSYLENSEHRSPKEVHNDKANRKQEEQKEVLRTILSQGASIDVFFEISRLLDGMRRREYVAAQLRSKILKRHKFLSETTSDQLYGLDIKEMQLKRRVEERDFGVSSARIDSKEDLLIKKVAVSMDPVTNLVLQVALGEGGEDHAVVLSTLEESLRLATAVPKKNKAISEDELHILMDRAKALVSLCENLREEYLERMNQNGRSPRLEQLFAKQQRQYEFRNLLQKYGSVSSNFAAILQSRIRTLLYTRTKFARTLQALTRRSICRYGFIENVRSCDLLRAVLKRRLTDTMGLGAIDLKSVSCMSCDEFDSNLTPDRFRRCRQGPHSLETKQDRRKSERKCRACMIACPRRSARSKTLSGGLGKLARVRRQLSGRSCDRYRTATCLNFRPSIPLRVRMRRHLAYRHQTKPMLTK
mmetsp:Transcript_19096/g.43797  ORF Transcript_19096/g.43797 Transcript_19096/m.43797 type:complete len:466 (-) Transcript_19096:232-1629(-)